MKQIPWVIFCLLIIWSVAYAGSILVDSVQPATAPSVAVGGANNVIAGNMTVGTNLVVSNHVTALNITAISNDVDTTELNVGSVSNSLGTTILNQNSISNNILPASPSEGDMVRYDGTNWIKTSGYVDRGVDATAYDYTATDFPTTNAWAQFTKLTNVIPVGTKAVCLQIGTASTIANRAFGLRKYGYTNNYGFAWFVTQVANLGNYGTLVVSVDTNRYLSYFREDGNLNSISIVVSGWWF